MKNHLIKIHNQADVTNLPLLQAINIAMRTESDQDELDDLPDSGVNVIESLGLETM